MKCENNLKANKDTFECKSVNFTKMDWSFKDGKCFCNTFYFGDVIFSNQEIIQVECKNENEFMHGQILTFNNRKPLKVGDWVEYQGKEYQVAIVNEDSTVRLATDDTTQRSYDNGTIGCFSQGMLIKIEKK